MKCICAKFSKIQLNYENYIANFYGCCPSGVGKETPRSIRIESSVNKIDIFFTSGFNCIFIFVLYLNFFKFTEIFYEWRKDKLNEENKLRSPRKLLKGISNDTFSRLFVTFKNKAVKNQMRKVKPKVSTIWRMYLQVYWQINDSYLNQIRSYSHFQNILRLFDIFSNFPFTPVKRCVVITYEHSIYELLSELLNDLRIRKLRNIKKEPKLHKMIT